MTYYLVITLTFTVIGAWVKLKKNSEANELDRQLPVISYVGQNRVNIQTNMLTDNYTYSSLSRLHLIGNFSGTKAHVNFNSILWIP